MLLQFREPRAVYFAARSTATRRKHPLHLAGHRGRRFRAACVLRPLHAERQRLLGLSQHGPKIRAARRPDTGDRF